MSWLRSLWGWLVGLFHPSKGILVTLSATASLTSSGNLASPKLGDIHTYTVTVVGEIANMGSVGPGTFTEDAQSIPVGGGPWTWPIPHADAFGPPVISGFTYTKPMTQTADPHIWVATY